MRGLLARWLWVVVGVVVGLVAFGAYGESLSSSASYTANASVVVRPISQNPFNTANSTPDKQLTMPNEVVLGKSQLTLQRTSAALHGSLTVDQLRKHSSVSNPANTTVLKFAYTSHSKATAADVANALASSYLVQRQVQAQQVLAAQSKSLNSSVSSLNQQASMLSKALSQLSLTSPSRDGLTSQLAQVTGSLRDEQSQIATLNAIDTTPGQLVEPATPPNYRDGPSVTLLLVAGGVIGGILGFLAALLLVRLNKRVRHSYELTDEDRIGVVMEIPRGNSQAVSEAWRVLAVRLHNRGVGDIYRRITITSPRGEADRNAVARLVHVLREIGLPAEMTTMLAPSQPDNVVYVSANPMSDGAAALKTLSRADAAVVLFARGTKWGRLSSLFGLLAEARVPIVATGILATRVGGRGASTPSTPRTAVPERTPVGSDGTRA